jgi:hypothetical protein
MEPAKELARFDPLLGNWEGSGTATGSAGKQTKWTSKATVQKILGGHYVQDDTRVDLEDMPAPLVFRTVFAWNVAEQRFTEMSLGNTGEAKRADVYWTEDGGLIGTGTAVDQGRPVVRRSVTKLTGKDTFEFRMDQAVGTGEFERKVFGTYKRGGTGFSAGETCAPVAPPSGELKKFDGSLGDWSLKGSASMTPGTEMMAFTGQMSVRTILGGHVQFALMKGGDTPGMPVWEGHWYLAYEPSTRTCRAFMFDNMGNAQSEQKFAAGTDRFIGVSAGWMEGRPQALRSVSEVTKDRIRATSHRLADDHAPEKCFEGEWTRIDTKSDVKPASDRGDKK